MTPERGATLPLVAAALFLLAVAAAWAVDVSAFYAGLRTDQTVADLACLAAAAELPEAGEAIRQASAYTQANWPSMRSASLTLAGDQGVLAGPAGRAVYTAGVDGDPELFQVVVTSDRAAGFGGVAGVDSVTLTQTATCSGRSPSQTRRVIPFGAPVGGFDGGLFAPHPCGGGAGNCGALFISGEGRSDFVRDTADGAPVAVTPNPVGTPTSDCRTVGAGEQCDLVGSRTGVAASAVGDALLALLDGPVHECRSWVRGGDSYNCDSSAQVLGGSPEPLMSRFTSRPAWWDTSLYGGYDTANTTNHFYWDQPIAHCDSPRLVAIPIVTADLAWKLGNAPSGWPSGRKDMKVVGMLDVIIQQPFSDADFTGSGNLKRATAAVIWFGPEATCVGGGAAYGVLNGSDQRNGRSVRLEPNG